MKNRLSVIGNTLILTRFYMSPNRRIMLNIIATYGRSLYALVCGLFISWWVLAALGKEDFGLYGVVGGLMVVWLMASTMYMAYGGIA